MSFVSILKKIGRAAYGIEHIIAPIAELEFPQFATIIAFADGIFGRVVGDVATAEAADPSEGRGPEKAKAVIANFEAQLEFTQRILAANNQKLTYDVGLLKESIDAFSLGYNKLAAVQQSFKVVSNQ